MAIAMDKLKQGRCVSLLTYIFRVVQVPILCHPASCFFGQAPLLRGLPYLVSSSHIVGLPNSEMSEHVNTQESTLD